VQPKPPAAVLLNPIILVSSHQEHSLATRCFDRHELSGAVQLALYAWQTPWFRKHCPVIQQPPERALTAMGPLSLPFGITSPGWFASGSGEERKNEGELSARRSHEFLSRITPTSILVASGINALSGLDEFRTTLLTHSFIFFHTLSCRSGL
jgi:hypothetical protein